MPNYLIHSLRKQMEQEKINTTNLSDVNSNVFNGSLGMIGVCLTVVSLFHISDKRALSHMAECLCIATFIFLMSAFFAYNSIRLSNHQLFCKLADVFFVCGLLLIVTAGIIMLLEL